MKYVRAGTRPALGVNASAVKLRRRGLLGGHDDEHTTLHVAVDTRLVKTVPVNTRLLAGLRPTRKEPLLGDMVTVVGTACWLGVDEGRDEGGTGFEGRDEGRKSG